MCHACARLDLARAGLCDGRAVVRCARAQSYSGGVLSMAKGAVLFDTVAISGTEATVRASRVDVRGGGCGRTGCRADCGGHGCVGCAQYGGGGGVSMGGGAVTFKGSTISKSKAVRARPSRFHFACCMLQMLMLCDAIPPMMLHAT